jgi:ABC-2 type transport system ATP-binding protein
MNDLIVRIDGLSRRFGKKQVLEGISLSIQRGTVFGLVGENGAGKTTLIKHILGLLNVQAGKVRVFDRDPALDPVGVLGRIGYLSEERDLPDWMRVGQLLSYSRAFYPSWDDRFARELLAAFELSPKQKIRTLSRGQRARAGLLVALTHRPDLLVLDEPSSGLDPIVRRDILSAIIRTVADEGRTVLFSSHLLDEVERVADTAAMLAGGRLILHGEVQTIVTDHRRLTLRFPQHLEIAPTLPGALAWSGEGREWTCLVNGKKLHLQAAAEALGASIVAEQSPSLEEIFVSRIRGGSQAQSPIREGGHAS